MQPIVPAAPAISAPVAAPVQVAIAPAAVAAPASPVAEPRRETAPRPAAIPVPPITAALPPESGLELVETRFAPAPVVDDAPPPPRRVRPPRVVLDEQPLQFVETRKDSPPPA
jgi:hypothetical protein